MRRAIILGFGVAAILVVAYLWPTFSASSVENGSANATICLAGHCCCGGRAQADTAAVDGAHGRLTLDPDQFTGPVKEAYKFAEENPALLTELHCYCGCDRVYGHRSLLDCYRGTHGATSGICTGEALMAKQLSEQGSLVDQIRDALRTNFSRSY